MQTLNHNTPRPSNVAEVFDNHTENAILTSFVANRRIYLVAKRILDLLVSLILIITTLSWLIPILSIWIMLDSKGPVFFIQKRIGLNGTVFRCIKFRTMKVNAEADEIAARDNDPRITFSGSFLRKTRIDELPQLFNVLMGSMSLSGPRPHMVSDCIRFSNVVESYRFRNLVKPGITGLAQLKGYRGPANDYESIRNRYYWDEVYVRNAGLWLDLKIILGTVVLGSRKSIKEK